MDILQQFMAYAADFEKTLADDDWSRLRRYFADDAVYEIKGEPLACVLRGPEAIFAGMKKSLDGFDRKFSGRDAELTSAPEIAADGMRVGWKVTYKHEQWPPFVLHGETTVRYAGERIAYLADSFDERMNSEFEAWQRQTGVELDPSYV